MITDEMVERLNQHAGWLKNYAMLTSDADWRDMIDLIKRQANELSSDINNLRAALQGSVVVPSEAINYARMMANICFNASQSSAIDASLRKSMKECQVGFDAAIASSVPRNGRDTTTNRGVS